MSYVEKSDFTKQQYHFNQGNGILTFYFRRYSTFFHTTIISLYILYYNLLNYFICITDTCRFDKKSIVLYC